jgi:hypothetical protein
MIFIKRKFYFRSNNGHNLDFVYQQRLIDNKIRFFVIEKKNKTKQFILGSSYSTLYIHDLYIKCKLYKETFKLLYQCRML